MVKHNVAYIKCISVTEYHSAIKMEKALSVSTTRINLRDISFSGVIQAQKMHVTRFHMHVESKVVLLLEAESRMVVAQGWAGGTRSKDLRFS